jgi:hypothetical protein
MTFAGLWGDARDEVRLRSQVGPRANERQPDCPGAALSVSPAIKVAAVEITLGLDMADHGDGTPNGPRFCLDCRSERPVMAAVAAPDFWLDMLVNARNTPEDDHDNRVYSRSVTRSPPRATARSDGPHRQTGLRCGVSTATCRQRLFLSSPNWPSARHDQHQGRCPRQEPRRASNSPARSSQACHCRPYYRSTAF